MLFWFGSFFMMVFTGLFLYYGSRHLQNVRYIHYALTFMPLIMAGAYLAMSNGVWAIKTDGYWFYLARYVGWVFVLPLMAFILFALSRDAKGGIVTTKELVYAVATGMMTVVFGALSILSYSDGRIWALCMGAISLILFLYIVMLRYGASVKGQSQSMISLYTRLSMVVGVLFPGYFALTVLGEAWVGMYSVVTENFALTLLDITTIGLVGYLVYTHSFEPEKKPKQKTKSKKIKSL
ncbi:bacteriorhodopsin [candidate division WWE3 bacterium]|uniref:Bacteriorhodopsin n=1 Tax=candidate division WWE3 bacterium TaxID=2053526 RepID=A0A955LVK9_UNCKA|nr:bacteriorhodopsin [candidate division WWE3 bacterium]